MADENRTGPPIFRNLSIEAGDIVLVRSNPAKLHGNLKRYVNINGQRVLASIRGGGSARAEIPSSGHSHVMLGMGDGLVIHADGHSVVYEVASDALKFGQDEADSFAVYRNPRLSPVAIHAITRAAKSYYSKLYRFSTFFGAEKDGDTTQFCSRLIAYAYRRAAVPFSRLKDQRTLPIDLFHACQEEPWHDVTQDVIEAPLSAEACAVLAKIANEAGLPPWIDDLPDLLAQSQQTQLAILRMNAGIKEYEYKSYCNIAKQVEMMAELSLLQLEQALDMLAYPETMDADFAATVTDALQQLPALLAIAGLPNLDQRLEIYPGLDYNDDTPPYQGLPSPAAIRKMQLKREASGIYAALVLVDIGLSSILWRKTGHEHFSKFACVKTQYLLNFKALLPSTSELAHYEALPAAFAWAGNLEVQQKFTQIFSRLINLVKLLRLRHGQACNPQH
ncbi:hypothetical protein [Pseudoduganella violacea]|uniref:Permuted papain-like amidase enzyme, YaeF/YiiX, C92 family n=1 Tax=Pseudoduganella violacea TaxID=1715466 RepID=A0A7W5BF70_9BURK|nr:hypothetical protein [Pseudoduganella violacea]MBB3122023.1 hypothetical protein [Pseudoduganella violacea]